MVIYYIMNITPTARAKIDQIKKQLPTDQFAITRETVNNKLWVRLDFGDLFIPVPCPDNLAYDTATLDYRDQKFIITSPR